VDEFQDVYPSLFSMLLPLFEISKPFVIGDARQSIYGFLGGSPVFIGYLEKWLPGVKRYQLPANRRSTRNIIEVSESVLPSGMLKARPTKTDDIPVQKVVSSDETMDAKSILKHARSFSDDVMVIARVGADTATEAKAYETACRAVGARFFTFHGSKGKESETVVVAGLVSRPRGSWNVPPHAHDHPLIEAIKKRNGGQSREDEERRLLYVAMSRAKKNMVLVTGKNISAPLAAEPLSRCREVVLKS
jgi:superfamily I DNA/RNA helicase